MSIGTFAQHKLNEKELAIVSISAFTASGDLVQLQMELNKGLDAGMSVNEIKEVLVHLSAYCGFPRSLQAINTFIAVLGSRKAKGITDKLGREPSSVTITLSKYDHGKQVLEKLTGQPAQTTGYALFAPVIDTFLKENLFSEIFGRDVLTYREREIATISALISLGGVEPMLQSHLRIAMNLGMTDAQLKSLLSTMDGKVGLEKSDAGRRIFNELMKAAVPPTVDTGRIKNLFDKGERAPASSFTGTVWVNHLVQVSDGLNSSVAIVTFEPGARTNWHRHPGGQILLVTEGKGYYQEKGQQIKIIQKGDVIKCPIGVEHWHGALPDTKLVHIAIVPNADKGTAVWMQLVTDKEYKSFTPNK